MEPQPAAAVWSPEYALPEPPPEPELSRLQGWTRAGVQGARMVAGEVWGALVGDEDEDEDEDDRPPLPRCEADCSRAGSGPLAVLRSASGSLAAAGAAALKSISGLLSSREASPLADPGFDLLPRTKQQARGMDAERAARAFIDPMRFHGL